MDHHQHGEDHEPLPAWARELWAQTWALQAHYGALNYRTGQLETHMATQADLDNLTAQLTAADQGIQAEIAALQAANPELDLSSLTAAVAATAALVPAAPDAPVDPEA